MSGVNLSVDKDGSLGIDIRTGGRGLGFILSRKLRDCGWYYSERERIGGHVDAGEFSAEQVRDIVAWCVAAASPPPRAVTTPSEIAARYLDARRALGSAEHVLDEAMVAHLGDVEGEWFGDPYDSSLEVFVPDLPVERVTDLAAFVLSLGFQRCWVHRHEGQRDKCSQPRCGRDHYVEATP